MKLAKLINLNLIHQYQKVEIRNHENCMSCKGIKIEDGLSIDNPLLTKNDWGFDITNWNINHIYTQEDVIYIVLNDPRKELRNVQKKETEYIKKIRNLIKKGGNLYV